MVLMKYIVSDCRTLFFSTLFFDFRYLCQLLSGKTCPHGDFAVTGIVCFTATVKPVLNGPPVKRSPYNRQTLAAKIHLLSVAYVWKTNQP